MKNPLVTISILSYNDERTIETAIKSAALQLYPHIELIVLDNNSKDRSRNILKKIRDILPGLRTAHLKKYGIKNETFRYHVLESKENLGFAKGHNRVISISQGEFMLLLNSDAGLDDQFLACALPYFQKDKKVSAIQGKLYRYDPQTEETKMDEKTQKPILDTTGLTMFRNRRIVNRGQGMPDLDQFATGEIFGADGAAPLYRRSALEDVKICLGAKCEYLDEDFFTYKEDIDLAWRLKLYGWKALYVEEAIGYHQRGSGDSAATSFIAILRERRKLSRFAKYHAFKNQRLMQLKNEFPGLLFRDVFFWAPKELGSWIYVLLFEHFTIKSISKIVRLFPKMLKKRRIIMHKRRVKAGELAKWLK